MDFLSTSPAPPAPPAPAPSPLPQVFINPPSGIIGKDPLQGLFLERATREVSKARVSECLLLLKAAVGQRWFARVFDHPHCWLSERAQKKSAGAAAGAGMEELQQATRQMDTKKSNNCKIEQWM